MIGIASGKMNRRIRIERPVPDDSFDGAGSGSWALVKEVWAEVQDELPSTSNREHLTDGVNLASRRSRVRIYYRDGITSDMRFLLLRKRAGVVEVERTMQIVGPPAILGNRQRIEFMMEDYSTAGNPA